MLQLARSRTLRTQTLRRTLSHLPVPCRGLRSPTRLYSTNSATSRRISWWRVSGLTTLALGIGGAAYYKYESDLIAKEEAEMPKQIPPPVRPEAYIHPYSRWPWYRRYLFILRRIMYLSYIWTPCLASIIYTLARGKKQDIEWIDWLLDQAVACLELSGAGFLKFGQWVAMRPDLFPHRLCTALAKLQDNAPVHTFEDTEAMVSAAFGKSLEDIFEEFDPTPIASGSVAQVHKAKLKEKYVFENGKRDVAVKVRHPGVLDSSFVDVWLIFTCMTMLPKAGGLQICMPFKKEEFYNNIQKQVDFKWEAYNLLQFSRNFYRETSASDPKSSQISVMFPSVHTELLSEDILVETWAPGENLSAMLARGSSTRSKVWDAHSPESNKPEVESKLSEEEITLRKRIARRCCDLAAKMFLRDNYIHGDLHAGNLLYSAKDNLLTVVDAGLTTVLAKESFVPFGDFLRALCVGDASVCVEKLIEFNVNEKFNRSSVPAFTEDVNLIFDKYMGSDRAKQEDQLVMGYIMGEVLNTIGKHSITLRGDVSSSLMTISISEGLILSLDPSFDLVGRCLPYFVTYAGWDSIKAIQQGPYYSTDAKATTLKSEGVGKVID